MAPLVLEDGSVFAGESVGAPGCAFGEAVFTTSMSGYQEVATDPSFEAQIVCFTAPMVGNYGTDPGRCESRRAHARGVVMREARGPEWPEWLREHGVVAVTGVDTRSLVLHLRERGAMRAALAVGRRRRRRVARPGARAARDGGNAARRGRLDARPIHVHRPRARASRGRRLRLQAVDHPAPRRGRRGGRRLPTRRRRRHGRPLRRSAALSGAGRSCTARRRDRRWCASCSGARTSSASASATS